MFSNAIGSARVVGAWAHGLVDVPSALLPYSEGLGGALDSIVAAVVLARSKVGIDARIKVVRPFRR